MKTITLKVSDRLAESVLHLSRLENITKSQFIKRSILWYIEEGITLDVLPKEEERKEEKRSKREVKEKKQREIRACAIAGQGCLRRSPRFRRMRSRTRR